MSLKVEVAEAFCSALYMMPFAEFLGETDHEDGSWSAWFHLGENPKDMRVTVHRPADREFVDLKVEWRNYWADARNPLKAEQTLAVSTYAATQDDLGPATQLAMTRVLEIFKDVLEETGVAGDISLLQQNEEVPETVEDELDAAADAAREQKGSE